MYNQRYSSVSENNEQEFGMRFKKMLLIHVDYLLYCVYKVILLSYRQCVS
ncbi:hypothetical protein Fsol_00032 [Candidatus Fokinia solitaria]|uniref:Uncharacterized protein n=1 Tax=Candidatus Fokinia solitaria TaxID=1802984 RepID=A0A2U8BR83_9RICK|nr:hypothetical protein Fsol_00032 [Candidatus Fokinia solitaria]